MTISAALIKGQVADYFDSQAGWRWEVAGRYPEDFRNQMWASRLNSFAEAVRKLPDDDERLRAIAGTCERYEVETEFLWVPPAIGLTFSKPHTDDFATWFAFFHVRWEKELELEWREIGQYV